MARNLIYLIANWMAIVQNGQKIKPNYKLKLWRLKK
jgi:hypothetical protein